MKYDKDKGGTLDAAEFKKMVRVAMKVTPQDLPDRDIDLLIKALDDDGGGTLSIDELADFVERGTATFFSGPEEEEKEPREAEPTGRFVPSARTSNACASA